MTPESPRTSEATALQQQASDPTANVWVSASAGTGKTQVLTDRVLRLLLPRPLSRGGWAPGSPPDKILCLTFTKAAAAEMANRVHKTLAAWAVIPDAELDQALHRLTGAMPNQGLRDSARRLFATVVDAPGGLRLMTIHAFCVSVLQRFPLEAGVPPNFNSLEEPQADTLLQAAITAVIEDARRRTDSLVTDAVADLARRIPLETFLDLLKSALARRGLVQQILQFRGGLEGVLARLAEVLEVDPSQSPEDVLAAACAETAFDGESLRAAATDLAQGGKRDAEKAAVMAPWLAADPSERVGLFDAYKRAFLTAQGTLLNKATNKENQQWQDVMRSEAARVLAVERQRLDLTAYRLNAVLWRVMIAVLDRYARAKADAAALDFDDQINRTKALLQHSDIAAWVLYKLDGGIDHLLVDEAQDTSPEQWAVIRGLIQEFYSGLTARDDPDAAPRTVFVVGDAKQSIYSFQGADVAVFETTRRELHQEVTAAEAPWRAVPMRISFRSVPAVLRAVDAVFADPAARDGVAEDPVTHLSVREGMAGTVVLWPRLGPPEPVQHDPWGEDEGAATPLEPRLLLAERIAAQISAWITSGERLEARDRAIEPGDILILVRSRTSFVPAVIRALKRHNIPVAGADRLPMTDHLAVQDLMALARFILQPDDDLNLAVVLKGPLVGWDEATLMALACDRKGALWRALKDAADTTPAWQPVTAWLRGLRRDMAGLRPFEVFNRLLTTPCPADPRSGRRAILARLGQDALDPLDELLSASLVYEASAIPSLEGFIDRLTRESHEIKREGEPEGSNAVRIMTVHGAKGLQAPIVILPDTVSKPKPPSGLLWPRNAAGMPIWVPQQAMAPAAYDALRQEAISAQDQEYRRLLYVAMTRAADRLYIAGAETRQRPDPGCWRALIEAAFADPTMAATVAEIPDSAWPEGPSLRLHIAQMADPEAPRRTTPTPAPSEEMLPAWTLAPPPPEPSPPRPLQPSHLGDDGAVRSPRDDADGLALTRGRIVHALLERLPALPPENWETAARAYLAQPGHGLPESVQTTLFSEVLAVLRDPAFAPVFGPGSRAEVSLAGRLGDTPDAPLIAGRLDRLIVRPEEILVVDYKTNRPAPTDPEAVPAATRRQMQLYHRALTALYPDRPVRCALLWTDGPHLMPLPEAMLTLSNP